MASPKGAKCTIEGPPDLKSFNALTGLNLDPQTCAISGIASKVLSKTRFSINLQNSAGAKSFIMYIQINNVVPKITFAKSSYSFGLKKAVSLTPLALSLKNTDDLMCSISPSTLPSGLSFDPYTCKISGTTKAAFTMTAFTITAKTSGGANSTFFSLEVK